MHLLVCSLTVLTLGTRYVWVADKRRGSAHGALLATAAALEVNRAPDCLRTWQEQQSDFSHPYVSSSGVSLTNPQNSCDQTAKNRTDTNRHSKLTSWPAANLQHVLSPRAVKRLPPICQSEVRRSISVLISRAPNPLACPLYQPSWLARPRVLILNHQAREVETLILSMFPHFLSCAWRAPIVHGAI